MPLEKLLAGLAIAYLVCSLNPAHALGKWKGIDLGRKGKYRNYGASNVRSVFGWKWGAAVGLIDLFKGAAVAAFAVLWLQLSQLAVAVVCAMAIVGHRYPFYLKFRGGKGVAAGVGAYFFFLVYYQNLTSVVICVVGFFYAVAVSPKFRHVLLRIIGIKA